jgi:hypothetical protein
MSKKGLKFFVCRKCRVNWSDLVIGYSLCSRCGDVTWVIPMPAGCMWVDSGRKVK